MTGSSPKAEDGTLTIMAGGSAEDFARAQPLLRVMGELVVHVGELGQGEMLKIINNSVAAANATAVGEALLVAQRTGVDLDALVAGHGQGLGRLGDARAEVRGDARARLRHAVQARAHAQGRAPVPRGGQAAAVPFPAAARARDVLVAAMARGHADDDFAALIEALEAFAGARLDFNRAIARWDRRSHKSNPTN